MPPIRLLAAVLITLAAAIGVAGCGSEDAADIAAGETVATSTPSVGADSSDVVAAVANGATLLDVRTQEEYDAGHAEGATLLPLAELQKGQLPSTAMNERVIVYCRSGNRSAQAAEILKQAGYSNVTDLGALDNWEQAGGKIVK